jgi:hypothetical protein
MRARNYSLRCTLHADATILGVWSLALIGNASGQTFGAERDIEPRRFR